MSTTILKVIICPGAFRVRGEFGLKAWLGFSQLYTFKGLGSRTLKSWYVLVLSKVTSRLSF